MNFNFYVHNKHIIAFTFYMKIYNSIRYCTPLNVLFFYYASTTLCQYSFTRNEIYVKVLVVVKKWHEEIHHGLSY